ncbi:MAG: hypothetical protein ACREHD_09835 [Pirellulales bacterium]
MHRLALLVGRGGGKGNKTGRLAYVLHSGSLLRETLGVRLFAREGSTEDENNQACANKSTNHR